MMPAPLKKSTTRYILLKTLAAYPDGLSAPRLRFLVLKDYAISTDHYVNVVLCQELAKGFAARVGKRECECCGKIYIIYKITKKGIGVLDAIK